MSRNPVPGEESGLDHDIQQGQQASPQTTGDQLEKEVYEIMDFLVMLEFNCVETNKDYAESKGVPTMPQWYTLFFIHKMLLNRHQELFFCFTAANCKPDTATVT